MQTPTRWTWPACRTLPKDQASDVFAELEPETQQNIISAITDQELSPEEMPAMVVKRVLKNAKPETRTLINQFLKYPMDLHKDMTVLQAIDRIRKRGEESEQIYTCYVTAVIEDIMETDIITASTLDDKETSAQTMMKYDFLAMPVVDENQRIYPGEKPNRLADVPDDLRHVYRQHPHPL